MEKIKKIIIGIIIILIVLSLGLNVFIFKPKKAQAILGIGDISIDPIQEIKEWILDEVPKRIARHMMVRLQQEIVRWAQGGFRDDNKPFALISWKDEVINALNLASAKFIEEFHLTPLCVPFRFTIGQRLGLAQPYYSMPYYQQSLPQI